MTCIKLAVVTHLAHRCGRWSTAGPDTCTSCIVGHASPAHSGGTPPQTLQQPLNFTLVTFWHYIATGTAVHSCVRHYTANAAPGTAGYSHVWHLTASMNPLTLSSCSRVMVMNLTVNLPTLSSCSRVMVMNLTVNLPTLSSCYRVTVINLSCLWT